MSGKASYIEASLLIKMKEEKLERKRQKRDREIMSMKERESEIERR